MKNPQIIQRISQKMTRIFEKIQLDDNWQIYVIIVCVRPKFKHSPSPNADAALRENLNMKTDVTTKLAMQFNIFHGKEHEFSTLVSITTGKFWLRDEKELRLDEKMTTALFYRPRACSHISNAGLGANDI